MSFISFLNEVSPGSKVFLAIFTIVIIQRITSNYLWHKKYKLPPLIPGLPILGNTFQLPPIQQGQWAVEQAKKYGEMYTCKFGVNYWIFLNSTRTVTDLLEKRASIYSSRQHFPLASNIMSGGCRILLMPYGDRWRAIRKVMHTILNKTNNPIYAPFQDIESKHLLYDYLHHPEKWQLANLRYSNSVIMSVIFGKRMDLADPDTEELAQTAREIIRAVQPGFSLVDSLPILENLPRFLQWWRGYGEREHQKCLRVYRREVEDMKRRVEAGTARDCFALQFMKTPDAHKFGESQFLYSLGSLMEAGSDTSRIAIGQVLCAAATDKRWVIKAQAELDRVCGKNAERLPSATDRPNLPYITAVVKETMRWRPMAQIGFPHMLSQDDEYEGYRFPKGTIFTWNATAIALNEDEFEEPLRFMPERFMNSDLENPLKGHLSFGPGRRQCTGYSVGDTNVWMAISRLLYCFEFDPPEGVELDTLRVNWSKFEEPPYPLDIKVRSPAHAVLIEREGKVASEIKY